MNDFALPLTEPELVRETGSGSVMRRTIHPSGLRVLSENMPSTSTVTIAFWVPVGSRDEDPQRYGSTHFLEHLLFKGTAARSYLDIARSFDAVGADSNALTGKEYTAYHVTCRATDAPALLEVLADMVTSSVLDPKEFENERGVILEELARAADDPSDVANELFDTLVYPNHELGRPIGGTPETIRAVKRDEVASHYAKHYRPETIVVTAAGAIDHDWLAAAVFEALLKAGWPMDQTSEPKLRRGLDLAPLQYRPQQSLLVREIEQEHILIGAPGVPVTDERKYALDIAMTILGGGMSSRLFQEIREKHGLAYAVAAYGQRHSSGGDFEMYVGTKPEKAVDAAKIMVEQLQILPDTLTEADLNHAKGQIVGGLTLASEGVGARMGRLGRAEILTGEFLDLEESMRRFESVTMDQAVAAAQFLAESPLSLAAVGPVKHLPDLIY